jgi:glutathione-regulated potassium-efflux system ancillary protein KefC/glutathione-regulated potassium-efflux system protein KefB
MTLLSQTAIFLVAAVVTVPLFKRLKLGAVLGFLAAGLVIGPWGLRFITEVENILTFAELGVVLLLFLIGLELQPSRLRALRKPVFGLGGLQVAGSTVVLGAIALAFGLPWQAALIVGVALSMNSTAFVLQLLAERKQLATRHGRTAFSIALFQDMAVIPMLAVIPLLVATEGARAGNPWLGALKAAAVIALVIFGGRHLLRPVLKAVAESGIQEIFTGAALLVVLGVALLMESVGLSMTLGAFLAGVLLADSEYRHEIEASIEPFKGLLLGLFFIAVGMSANLGLFVSQPLQVIGAALGLMLLKAAILFPVGRLSGDGIEGSRSLAVLLCHAGEFAFVLFNVALAAGAMTQASVDFLIVVVTLSMALTPVLFLFNENVLAPRLKARTAPDFDAIPAAEEPRVVIAGFGRVGQIVGRVLNARRVPFTALDISADQVDSVRRFGRQAYFGDAAKLDLLRAAKLDRAEIFVLAIDDVPASIRSAETVRKHFPHVTVVARARNRFHAHKLMELGVKLITRETFLSSLAMAQETLQTAGFGEAEARDTVARFRHHDEEVLLRQFAVRQDEDKLIQSAKEAIVELESLFDQDRDAPAEGHPMAAVDLARSWK